MIVIKLKDKKIKVPWFVFIRLIWIFFFFFCKCPFRPDLMKILLVSISNSCHSHPETKQQAKLLIKKKVVSHFQSRLVKSKQVETRHLASPTLSRRSAGDRDPLQNLDVSASFGFLQILLDVQQQDLHRVNSVLDVRDTVQDGERSSDVFTEQWLPAHRGQMEFSFS